jgi:type II secretory ATPase GspE/PulE/Tfp pilus assembly ATPase PilB-like protein
VHEVLNVTSELAAAISRRSSDDELQRLAAAGGYRRMLQDGLEKARRGLVQLEDVLAVARAD